jgi:molybdopterin synthase catalytic subunit
MFCVLSDAVCGELPALMQIQTQHFPSTRLDEIAKSRIAAIRTDATPHSCRHHPRPLGRTAFHGCRQSCGFGAKVEFLGVIRPEEEGSVIQGIRYEAYEPMALRVMQEILDQLASELPFLAAEVVHRTGPVKVGEAAIVVRFWAKHRKEAFIACMRFMDNLKQDVPIWKTTTF